MKTQRVAIVLTAVNLILLVLNLTQNRPVEAQESVAPVLRGHALEIVDKEGNVRASISIEPPVTIDSRNYPETVRLRMGDPNREPGVKLTSSVEGTALGLSNGSQGGVQLYAKKTESYLKMVNKDGRERIVRP
jgi:hypothetical protein